MARHRLLGLAAAAAMVMASEAKAQTTQSATGSITIIEPSLTVNKTSDLSFGAVVRPPAGSGTISIDANSGNVTAGGGVSVAPGGEAATRAAFTVQGLANRNIQVTTPSNFTMTRASGSETLTATLTSSMGGGQLNGSGAATFYVGGQAVLSSSTVAGAYSGNFTVTVAYN